MNFKDTMLNGVNQSQKDEYRMKSSQTHRESRRVAAEAGERRWGDGIQGHRVSV